LVVAQFLAAAVVWINRISYQCNDWAPWRAHAYGPASAGTGLPCHADISLAGLVIGGAVDLAGQWLLVADVMRSECGELLHVSLLRSPAEAYPQQDPYARNGIAPGNFLALSMGATEVAHRNLERPDAEAQ